MLNPTLLETKASKQANIGSGTALISAANSKWMQHQWKALI